MTVIMTVHWTVSFRSARQVHVLFSSTGPCRSCAVYTLTEMHAQARKCGSKRYLGRWAFMATGLIEQVRRDGYTHIKRRGKRFHYSFVYGMPRLCTVQRLLREKSGCAVTKGRNVVRVENGMRFSGTKWRGRGQSSSIKIFSCLLQRLRSLKLCINW